MHLRSKKPLLLLLLLAVAAISLVTATYAWFVTVERTGTITLIAGEIKYELDPLSDYLITSENELIIPGEELMTQENGANREYQLKNLSSIDTELRIQIFASYRDGTETRKVEFTGSPSDLLIGEMSKNGENPLWEYRAVDGVGYWYYLTGEGDAGKNKIVVPDPETGALINVFTSLMFNGDTTGSDFATKDVVVTIYLQAKQYDFVAWENIGFIEG